MSSEYSPDNFDPNTGLRFSNFPPVRAFQKVTARIGFNALLATIPSVEDSLFKRRARNVAGHLLSAVNVNTSFEDPALLPGVSEGDLQLSGAEPRSRSARMVRAGAVVATAAATAAVLAPPIVEFADSGVEKILEIYEDANTIPNIVSDSSSSYSEPGAVRPPEYQYLYPDTFLEP